MHMQEVKSGKHPPCFSVRAAEMPEVHASRYTATRHKAIQAFDIIELEKAECLSPSCDLTYCAAVEDSGCCVQLTLVRKLTVDVKWFTNRLYIARDVRGMQLQMVQVAAQACCASVEGRSCMAPVQRTRPTGRPAPEAAAHPYEQAI